MRDMNKSPYSKDEERIAKWLDKISGVGGGDDPLGFVIASYDVLIHQRNVLRNSLSLIRLSIDELPVEKRLFVLGIIAGALSYYTNEVSYHNNLSILNKVLTKAMEYIASWEDNVSKAITQESYKETMILNKAKINELIKDYECSPYSITKENFLRMALKAVQKYINDFAPCEPGEEAEKTNTMLTNIAEVLDVTRSLIPSKITV